MSCSIDAVAVRPTTALVCLDQCAAQEPLDRRQIAHEPSATIAQGRRGKILKVHRTESQVHPSESKDESSVNLEFALRDGYDAFGQRGQAESIDEQRRCAGGSLLAGRGQVGPFPWHSE